MKKSRKPQKLIIAVEKLLTNIHIVGKDLLRTFSNWFCLQEFERQLYMKIIVTIFPINIVTNLLLSLFCLFVETKNKNQIFIKLVIW